MANASTTVTVSCPHCGKTVGMYGAADYRYGSPIRICKKCGGKFVNRFYHEIAIEGADPRAFDMKFAVMRMLIMLGIFLISVTWHAAEIFFSDRYSIAVAFIALISPILFFYCIFDIIDIKSGFKQKRIDKKYAESVERLKNKDYARELAEYGYNVPAEFLGENENVNNLKEDISP